MPRRKPREQTKHSERLGGHVDWKRGRHRKSDSAEVRRWENEHLIPKCPPWMDDETYRALAEMRSGL